MNKLFIFTIFLLLTGFSSTKLEKEHREFLDLLDGSGISVVAPGSACDTELFKNIQNVPKLNLRFQPNCFDSSNTLFHSHRDDIRLKCLTDALFDESTNIVWALRGGYGSAKLIEGLRKLPKPRKEKIFIGYSDITSLHLFLSQEWGWKTIHGAGILELLNDGKDKYNFKKIAQILSNKNGKSEISGLTPINLVAKNTKRVDGKLTGGNLTIVQTSIGTDWQIKTYGKIIFLEDVGIKAYELDRTLYHLKHASCFKNAKSIIFGSFAEYNKDILQVLSNFASNLDIPVFMTDKFGHNTINEPIIYETDSRIQSSSDGNFILTMKH